MATSPTDIVWDDAAQTPPAQSQAPAPPAAQPPASVPVGADIEWDTPASQATHAQPQDAQLSGNAPILVTGHRAGPLTDSSGHVILQDAEAIPQGQDTGVLGFNGGTHTEADPRFAGANNAVKAMINNGTSDSHILSYLKGLGASDQDILAIIPQLAKIREFQNTYKNNPKYKGYTGIVDLEKKQVPNSIKQNFMGSDVGAVATGLGNMSTLDNVAHIAGALGGDQDKVQTAIDASAAVHPKSALIGDIAGGAAATLGIDQALGATAIPGLARVAPEAAEGIAELAPVIRPAVADTSYGAGTGASATDTGPNGQPATALDRLKGAGEGALAALAGHVAGTAVGASAAAAGRSRAAAQAINQDFADAAQRQGITYMAADVPKSLKSRFATGLINNTSGALPIARAAEQNIGSVRSAIQNAAEDIGEVADRTGGGQAAQNGARQWLEDTNAKESELHNAIPIPASSPASVSNTRAALGDLAQSFQSNPKLASEFQDPKIGAYLDALTPQTTKEPTGVLDASGNPITRDVVHDGGLSWEDLKDFRSRVGQIIGKPGLASDPVQIGQLRSLYGALSEDMRATAANNGSGALNAFERANTYSRARADRIDNVVSLILGKNDEKGPQSAFEALQRLGNEKGGDPIKLAQALRSMPEGDANAVRATMLDDMAHAPAGQQNAEGTAFSPANFVTRWNQLSDRAKSVLFTGEHKQALDDIVKVASGMKGSTQFANTSKTGMTAMGTANVGLILHNPLLGISALAGQHGLGYLLASPRFARWMASASKKPNAQAFADHIGRLEGVARSTPAIANDVRSLQGKLSAVFAPGPKTRALGAIGGAAGANLATQR